MNTPVTGGFTGGRVYSSGMMMRRSSRFFALPPQPATALKTDFEGLGLVKSFVINEFEAIDGSTSFELMVDGKSVWLGMGDDQADGLLKAIMKITEQEPEAPDNLSDVVTSRSASASVFPDQRPFMVSLSDCQ
jgi:hypothetical protein